MMDSDICDRPSQTLATLCHRLYLTHRRRPPAPRLGLYGIQHIHLLDVSDSERRSRGRASLRAAHAKPFPSHGSRLSAKGFRFEIFRTFGLLLSKACCKPFCCGKPPSFMICLGIIKNLPFLRSSGSWKLSNAMGFRFESRRF